MPGALLSSMGFQSYKDKGYNITGDSWVWWLGSRLGSGKYIERGGPSHHSSH